MQTIGERLEEARKKKGISIREAAEATKIRGDYLQKFESNHFDIGLTEIYTRGFLRTYANYLKLPADRILNDYAALGRGDIRPRQPAREVYGRMDISVATAAESTERPAATEAAAGSEAANAQRGAQRRGPGSSLPSGPDPAVVFRYVKWGGVALVAIVGLMVIWSLLSGNSRRAKTGDPTTTQAANVTAQRGPTLGLVALGPVRVTVHRSNPDKTDGELLFDGMLAAGETKYVPRPGPVMIAVSAAENFQIEINGKRHGMGMGSGYQRGELPAPN